MDNGVGRDFRDAFEESLKVFGEDFHVSGETKRGILDDRTTKKISFSEEFPLKPGDTIRRHATETNYKVVSSRPFAIAGVFQHFEVIVAQS